MMADVYQEGRSTQSRKTVHRIDFLFEMPADEGNSAAPRVGTETTKIAAWANGGP
jgi:hypothetical protein